MIKFKGNTTLRANIVSNTFFIVCFIVLVIGARSYLSIKSVATDTAFNLMKRQNQALILYSMGYMKNADEEIKSLAVTISNEANLHEPKLLSKISKIMGTFSRVCNFVIPIDQNNYIFLSKISHSKPVKSAYLGAPIDYNCALVFGFVKTDDSKNIVANKFYYYSDDLVLIKEIQVQESILKESLVNLGVLIEQDSKVPKQLSYSKITNLAILPLVLPRNSVLGCAQPIYGEVSFDDLSLHLDVNRITESSALLLVDSEQRLIASSSLSENVEKLGVINLDDIQMKLFKEGVEESKKRLEAGEKDTATFFKYNNAEYMIINEVFPLMSKLNWRAIAVCKASEFTKIASIITEDTSIIFTLMIIAVCLFWLYFQVNKYSQPIVNLAIEAQKIRTFDLEDSVNVECTTKEIANLAAEIQNMKVNVKNFSRFIPKGLVQKFIHSGQDVSVGGKETEVSLLFTDIANFTTLSEAQDPTKLVTQLSEYLEELTNVILKNNGTVDKYIGDAIMAFWGAPDLDANQAENACISALICREKLGGLNKYWVNSGQCNFSTRFGIHRGKAVVGNIGSSERMNYTAIGDNVNLAARLEGSNKQYGTSILISEMVHSSIGDNFIRRPVDIVAFKGKTEGIKIYELIGTNEHAQLKPLSQKYRHYLDTYQEAYSEYERGKWKSAKKIFDKLRDEARERGVDDRLVQIYCERMEEFIKNPPPQDWNGIIHLKDK